MDVDRMGTARWLLAGAVIGAVVGARLGAIGMAVAL